MKTMVIPTKWALKHWMLIFAESVTDFEKSKLFEHITNLTKDNAGGVTCFASCPCWMYGQLYNRAGFKDNTSVITSRIDRIECVDNTLYVITESDSCYRLEVPEKAIGVRKENSDDITVQRIVDGKVSRYML